MARINRFSKQQDKRAKAAGPPPLARTATGFSKPPMKQAATRFGPPFVLLEDGSKNTFKFQRGAWLPHDQTIAQCRVDCRVKELPQKVNGMTRYEVRCPLP